MRRQLYMLSSLCLILAACDNVTSTGTGGTSDQDSSYGKPTSDNTIRADNTGRNVRDRSNQSLTSGDQSENETDRTITQNIRRALMDDDSLSTNAKNIKIITINGVVTLRGPVNTDREKNEIAKKAKAVNGVKSVDNQLEVNREKDSNFSDNHARDANTRDANVRNDRG